MSAADQERLLDLLAAEATEGLSGEERLELRALLAAHPDQDPAELELAAAAVELAHTREEEMPPALRRTLEAQAAAYRAGRQGGVESTSPASVPAAGTIPEVGPSWGRGLGWLAAAAALALAAMGWIPRLGGPADGPMEMPRSGLADRSAGQRLESLLARDPEALRLAWSATEDPAAAEASGEVVWSAALQEGYMRFSGLPVNDPRQYQYQLWIFDQERDERYPIDGGVFDIPSAGEVVVAIDPRLPVREATLFAVTIEKPGGVVVSSRERLPLVAGA